MYGISLVPLHVTVRLYGCIIAIARCVRLVHCIKSLSLPVVYGFQIEIMPRLARPPKPLTPTILRKGGLVMNTTIYGRWRLGYITNKSLHSRDLTATLFICFLNNRLFARWMMVPGLHYLRNTMLCMPHCLYMTYVSDIKVLHICTLVHT